MARISGIDIPREKRVIASLRYIHGVGAKRAEDICSDLKIDPDTRVSNLTNDEVAQIRKYIEANFRVEGDLRRDVSQNKKKNRNRNLSRGKAQIRTTCKRTKNTYKCTNKKRSKVCSCWNKEGP